MVSDQVKSEIRALVEEILKDMKNKEAKTEQTPTPNLIARLCRNRESLNSESDEPPKYNLYIDASLPDKNINFRLNRDLAAIVSQGAQQRGLSEASFVRESIMFRSNRASPNENREIDRLIQNCIEIKEGQRTFMFDGEQGFLTQASKRKLTGEIWTLENLDKIVLYLRNTSYTDKCIQALGLDRTQIQYLKVSIMATIDEIQKENEYLFMPFGMCNQCHRPLTNREFLESSMCSHCGHRQGQIIIYDMTNQDAFYKPFSVCSQCFKPLTEQQSHLWKACPYCQNTEPDIPINYEGIKTKTITHPKPKAEKETEKDAEEQEKPDKEETEPQDKLAQALNKMVESEKKNGG
jgi:uncharacterized CHY-type Zn-finger protein